MILPRRPEHYRGQLSDPESLGLSPIFRGKITTPTSSVHAFIKPINDLIRCPSTGKLVRNRALEAEVIGYSLAKTVGFEVPETAGAILMQAGQLPKPILKRLHSERGIAPQPDYLCWFSQDMTYPNLKQHMQYDALPEPIRSRRVTALAYELFQHPDTPRIVAFDDWLANSDRNLGNLLAGPSGLILIDHERIFVYPNWTPGLLGSVPDSWCNPLFSLLEDVDKPQANALTMRSGRALAFRNFSSALTKENISTINDTLAMLFSAPEITDIMELIKRRLKPESYAKAIGLLV